MKFKGLNQKGLKLLEDEILIEDIYIINEYLMTQATLMTLNIYSYLLVVIIG
jgi:hypothetical protein